MKVREEGRNRGEGVKYGRKSGGILVNERVLEREKERRE